MLSKLFAHLYLLRRPILINACVFFKDGKVVHENWGDDINYFFLKEIVMGPIDMFDKYSLAFRLRLRNYLVIGSTIDLLCKESTEVWGAGIIDGTKNLKIKPRKVYAVRGPLTRKLLIKQGVECPEIYGDPAMLVARYYKPHVDKKYKYGFISHVSNIDRVKSFRFGEKPILEREDTLVIDLSKYDRWTDIPDQICSCENIISASLHGLIMAEAYKIPNVWVEFGKPLLGGHFKFHDFFCSIGRDRIKPITIDENIVDNVRIDESLSSWQAGNINLQPLIDSCPFKLKTNL